MLTGAKPTILNSMRLRKKASFVLTALLLLLFSSCSSEGKIAGDFRVELGDDYSLIRINGGNYGLVEESADVIIKNGYPGIPEGIVKIQQHKNLIYGLALIHEGTTGQLNQEGYFLINTTNDEIIRGLDREAAQSIFMEYDCDISKLLDISEFLKGKKKIY